MFQTGLESLAEEGAWTSVGAHVTKEGSASVPEQQDGPHGALHGVALLQRVWMWLPLRSVVTRVHGPVLFGALQSAARVTRSQTTPGHMPSSLAV